MDRTKSREKLFALRDKIREEGLPTKVLRGGPGRSSSSESTRPKSAASTFRGTGSAPGPRASYDRIFPQDTQRSDLPPQLKVTWVPARGSWRDKDGDGRARDKGEDASEQVQVRC
jgi:hypothetical protein